MSDAAMFENRLRKNVRRLGRWAERQGLTAYRVYDKDIPELPFTVDWYAGRIHLVEFPSKKAVREGSAEALRAEVLTVVERVLEVPPERIFTKTHLPKAWGREQYSRQSDEAARFVVEENGLKFQVDLASYLDTGLFLDHRNTRARVRSEAGGKRFLNLFCYTGAFTVYAAAGGARETVSVDLSNTYLDWLELNLDLNGLAARHHILERGDANAWVQHAAGEGERFDLIVCDPPPFSTSKAMKGTFDVQRDHRRLIEQTASLLTPDGVLYFSENYLGFQLDERLERTLEIEELTPASLPEDFHQRDIHRCFRITRRPAAQRTSPAPTAAGSPRRPGRR